MKYLLLIAFYSNLVFSASAIEIFDTKSASFITYDEFISALPNKGHILLGEFHNNIDIQNIQTLIINDKINASKSSFTVHWEFLNHTEQTHIDYQFNLLKNNLQSSDDFIINTAGKNNLTYAPIIEVTAKLNGTLKGINIPRDIKQMVIRDGIDSIDQSLVPATHFVGDQNYRDRFSNVMGSHVPPEKIEAYFVAQCLTDSVMAHQIYTFENDLNFTVLGSFHSDFFDATTLKLQKLTNKEVSTLKIISKKDMTEEELNTYLSSDPLYGYFANYIILTN